MRLFISYARIDKPYCIQIVDLLDIHEVWYDQRLYAGQNWWNEILRRLEWCEGFVYLLSPESIQSDYCQREYDLVCSLGKAIFPVLIQAETSIPPALANLQYVDLSQGLAVEAVKALLNAIHRAEIQGQRSPFPTAGGIATISPPKIDAASVIGAAAQAMEKGNYDQAVFLLRQAKEHGFVSRFIDIQALLKEAETALERQSERREIEREYKQIAALVAHKATARLGCAAFQAFHREIKDYDPDHLAEKCQALQLPENPAAPPLPTLSRKTSDLPLLEWCSIPAGQVIFSYVDAQNQAQSVARAEEAFYISKYPVTNGLYHGFLKDSKGYANVDLWSFSNEAYQWYLANGTPKPSKFQGDDRPREMLNWYEAMVFCLWLSQRLEKHIRLPTLYEWQRAFQGDDQRPYPWGHKFEPTHCNTLESRLKMTSVVTRYAQGVSPFGVYDLAGNVWEWCLNLDTVGQFEADPKRVGKRIVRGGSFLSPGLRANATSLYALKPEIFHAAIGFRIAYKD